MFGILNVHSSYKIIVEGPKDTCPDTTNTARIRYGTDLV